MLSRFIKTYRPSYHRLYTKDQHVANMRLLLVKKYYFKPLNNEEYEYMTEQIKVFKNDTEDLIKNNLDFLYMCKSKIASEITSMKCHKENISTMTKINKLNKLSTKIDNNIKKLESIDIFNIPSLTMLYEDPSLENGELLLDQ